MGHVVRMFDSASEYQRWALKYQVEVVSVVVFKDLLVVTFRFLT